MTFPNRLRRVGARAVGVADVNAQADSFVVGLDGLPGVERRRVAAVAGAVIVDGQPEVVLLDIFLDQREGVVGRLANHGGQSDRLGVRRRRGARRPSSLGKLMTPQPVTVNPASLNFCAAVRHCSGVPRQGQCEPNNETL